MLTSSWPDIDRLVTLSATRVSATRVTSMSEDFYEHHFPGRPVVPAVMLLTKPLPWAIEK